MSTETIGGKLRQLREQNNMALRKVAVLLDIDVAILSKMERGERKITREVVLKLAEIYNYSEEDLLISYLTDKILYEIQDEDLGEKALRVAESRVKYLKANKKNDD